MSPNIIYGLTVIGGVVVVFQFVLSSRCSSLEVAFYHITVAGDGGAFHVHRATVVTLLTRLNALNFRLVETSSHAVEVEKPVG